MRFIFTTLLLLSISPLVKAQDGNWDVYVAPHEKGPGATMLNLDLVHTAPNKKLAFLVITELTYAACREDGWPENTELHHLNEISEAAGRVVAALTTSEPAGTFTYQCTRRDYLYVHDTLHLRDQLTALYTHKYPSYPYAIDIRQDRAWETYLKFLYPNEEVLEAMTNEKLLRPLRLAGDQPDKPRPVDHWLFFASGADRDRFIQYAAGEKFKIAGKNYLQDAELPYQLHLSRTDPVDPVSINKLTLALRRKARELKGDYDGWEARVRLD
jgi:hypothetical protein